MTLLSAPKNQGIIFLFVASTRVIVEKDYLKRRIKK